MNNNLILSIILSIAIIVGWQYFYETPRIKALQQRKANIEKNNLLAQKAEKPETMVPIEQSISTPTRVKIANGVINGSINLIGARIDDVLLTEYKDDLNDNHKVRLLAPSNTQESYFIELGWHSSDLNAKLPNSKTLWNAHTDKLTPEQPLILSWTNEDGVIFQIEFKLDDQYMLFVNQKVINNSKAPLELKTYSLINRLYKTTKNEAILHKGFLGVIGKELHELSYSDLKDHKTFPKPSTNWFGMTDKYWFTAIIPDQKNQNTINLHHTKNQNLDKYQLDILSELQTLEPSQTTETSNKVFVGAKKVKLLDQYVKQYGIKLFDRAIDFGRLYIITKPIFYVINFFHSILGNFGLSIIAITILIKALLFGLSVKSGKSIKKMKALQPKIDKIKKQYDHDKARLNQEIMALYKRENFNPLSGCLPILVQIPILFAIYKVLYVTIEMRHAPFYGWIGDLSAPDPTSILTLFGLIPVNLPSFLQIGVWPALMAISMFIQQKLTGNVASDPVQEQVMKLMPFMLLFMLAHFPAGLMIYWTVSNILSIVQQLYINKYVN
ncbi:inner membrane protein translocase component YidC [Candidatus Phycorickettsia trachydisci]|uniref:Membrane protein insertase YidC n=1 Tax=Candidatus Phycorickettsia trachydisci TaxID=2115978 RepID=A0A2P1P7T7_9RICK|nr:membrane protein insertase YidC [Candidatus Phycorickettsia trachydisci]AVP87333.1 inner membrane protein translocase component YidC [Candidatus Phycorickettsia trachydisci]